MPQYKGARCPSRTIFNKYFLIRQNSESKIETVKIQEREIREEIDDINNSLNALTRAKDLLKQKS